MKIQKNLGKVLVHQGERSSDFDMSEGFFLTCQDISLTLFVIGSGDNSHPKHSF